MVSFVLYFPHFLIVLRSFHSLILKYKLVWLTKCAMYRWTEGTRPMDWHMSHDFGLAQTWHGRTACY
jgi:hypothetical protein